MELTPELAPYVNLVAIVVAGVLVGKRYFKGLFAAEEKPAPPEVQIVGGALADRMAMRGLQEALERLTEVLERMIESQERRDREKGHAQEMAELRREIERLRSVPRT